MKSRLLLLTFPLFFIHCHTARPLASEHQQFKQVYISQFKLTYFRKLLLAEFNHSEEVKAIVRSDKSGFTEPILTADDYRIIDSLVYKDVQYLRTDSVSSIGKVAEGAEGKHVLNYIMKQLEGKWLKKIANNRYKQLERKTF